MKKLIVFIGFLLIIAVGCSSDITTNPTSPQDNSKVKSNVVSKQSSARRITYEEILPEALNFLETKRKEHGIKFNPDLKPGEPRIVDITKIPGIVVPTMSDIEKLSPGNEKYFSGYNIKRIANSSSGVNKNLKGQVLKVTEDLILRYWSWCVPYPSPEKPFFEYMGSEQSSNYIMDEMDIWSLHYDQGFHYLFDYNLYSTSLSVSDWHERSENQYYQVVGDHFFYRESDYPLVWTLTQSYAYDGE